MPSDLPRVGCKVRLRNRDHGYVTAEIRMYEPVDDPRIVVLTFDDVRYHDHGKPCRTLYVDALRRVMRPWGSAA